MLNTINEIFVYILLYMDRVLIKYIHICLKS